MNIFIGVGCRRLAAGPSRQAFNFSSAFRLAHRPPPTVAQTTRLHTLPLLPKPLPLPAPSPIATTQAEKWSILNILPTLRRSIRDYYNRPSRGSSSGGGWGGAPPPGSWWHRFRERIDRLPENYVTWGIIGLNVLVWIQWKIGLQNVKRFGDDQPLKFLLENFASSWENWKKGRIWTLLTASFSQINEWHLLINCFIIWSSAGTLMATIGVFRFLSVYLLGGVASSAVSVWWRGDRPGFALGASGAVYCALSLFACLFPTAEFLLFAIIPLPAWACLGGVFCWDAYYMLKKPKGQQGGSDNAGHVGGLVAGFLMYVFKFRKMRIW